jgi:glycine/D-amino acid oxidase-like deaminating enzyme
VNVIPNKGQLLTVKIPGFTMSRIVNYGNFLLPMGNSIFRVGSTFELEPKNALPDEEGKGQLISRLKEVFGLPFTFLDHEAGLRPTVYDRKPVIGVHPENNRMAFFNGLGSKGVLLAPFFANMLADLILNGKPVDKEVDVRRFFIKER